MQAQTHTYVARMHTYLDVKISIHKNACTHTHTHTQMHAYNTHTHTYTHTHVKIHIHKPVSKHTEYHSKGANPHNSLDSNKLCLLQTEGEPVPTTPLQNNSRRGAYSHDCPSRNRRGAYLHNCVDSSELCPLQSCRRWAYSHNCLNSKELCPCTEQQQNGSLFTSLF